MQDQELCIVRLLFGYPTLGLQRLLNVPLFSVRLRRSRETKGLCEWFRVHKCEQQVASVNWLSS